MPDKADKLVKLARAKFPKLLPFTAAEYKMLRAAAKGEPAVCGPVLDPALSPLLNANLSTIPRKHPIRKAKADLWRLWRRDGPRGANKWDDDRTIRAGLLRWLCIDAEARKHIDPKGVRVLAAWIDGRIDLAFANVPFPLELLYCALLKGIDLIHSDTRRLSFRSSHIGPTKGKADDNFVSIRADGLTVKGGLFLRNVVVRGEVRLLKANIATDLTCSGGWFKNEIGEEPTALNANSAEIGGSVFLNDGFGATGEVCLIGAKISGSLVCRGGRFKNENGYALSADGAEINGGLFLDKDFRINGQFRLVHASADVLVDDPKCWPALGMLAIDGFEYRAINPPGPTDAKTRKDWLGRQYPVLPKRQAVFQLLWRVFPILWKQAIRHEKKFSLRWRSASLKAFSKSIAIALNPGRGLFRPQPYEQLAKVLRLAGHKGEARKILIAKENARRKYSRMNWLKRFVHWLFKWSVGYGYRLWLALIWLVVFVGIGTTIYWDGPARGFIEPAKERVYLDKDYKETGQIPKEYPKFCAPIYSLDCFIPLVDLHQEDYWHPSPHCRWKWPLWGYLWFHIIAGWLLTYAVVAGITKVVRRRED